MTTATRSEALPDIPTVGDFVPGYEASAFRHRRTQGTRPPRSSTSSTRRSSCLADPKIKARIADWAARASGSPADFGKLIADETEKWAKVIKFAGIKAE